jgi:DNA gyrase subunit A
MFFTPDGRVYIEKVYRIPESGRTARGKAIVNMLNLQEDEKVAAMIRVREMSDDKYLVMSTEKGVVKKTCLGNFRHVRTKGIIAIRIDEGDTLIQVVQTKGDDDVILATSEGQSIRFNETQLRDQGRATRGVRGIRLKGDDVVKSMSIVDNESTFMTCTENGYGKKTEFSEHRVQGRGGSGIKAIQKCERNGKVVAGYTVKEDDSLMMITAKGKMIRMAISDFRVIGRSTKGVRLVNLDEGDKLVAAIAFEAEDEVEEVLDENGEPIGRPRQLYMGETLRPFKSFEER